MVKAIFMTGGDGICIARGRAPQDGEYALDTAPGQWTKGWEPRFYRDNGGTFEARADTDITAEKKLLALADKLVQIDAAVAQKVAEPFTYGDNTFYPDSEFIPQKVLSLAYKDDAYTVEWKTADKPDGINNVFVTLDKDGLVGLGLAYEAHREAAWRAGETHKQAVKLLLADELATEADILNYDITLT